MAAAASQRRAGLAGDRGEGIGVTSSDGSLHPWTNTYCTERKHLQGKWRAMTSAWKGCEEESVGLIEALKEVVGQFSRGLWTTAP